MDVEEFSVFVIMDNRAHCFYAALSRSDEKLDDAKRYFGFGRSASRLLESDPCRDGGLFARSDASLPSTTKLATTLSDYNNKYQTISFFASDTDVHE